MMYAHNREWSETLSFLGVYACYACLCYGHAVSYRGNCLMTRMIFVRHGQSTGNERHVFYGHFDGELSETGRKQVRAARDFLKDVHIDICYASDLKRAYETGTIICEGHGITPIADTELRELNGGLWENASFDELPSAYPVEFDLWKNDIWNACPPGGESIQSVARRIRAEVWRIAKLHEEKTVLIAFHATPIRTLMCEWTGVPYEKMNEIKWPANASVSVVNYDTQNEKIIPELIGYGGYEADIASKLSKNE